MEKLVILEFDVQDIHIHVINLPTDQFVDEEYIKNLGFDTNHCEWFIGCNVIYHGNKN